MDREIAEKELASSIRPNGDLYNLGHYTAWAVGDDTICLDDNFTADELEAIVWWMRNHG